jgi:hypothetical protein
MVCQSKSSARLRGDPLYAKRHIFLTKYRLTEKNRAVLRSTRPYLGVSFPFQAMFDNRVEPVTRNMQKG